MCKALDDMRKEAREEGREEALSDSIRASYSIAKKMNPDATEECIIRNLAEVYHKTQKAIRSIVLL